MQRTFGLIPGGLHGAWCWRELVRELEMLGHCAIAVQPPLSDHDAGLREYAQSAADQLDGAAPLTVIGHSMASAYLPMVAAAVDARSMVFLSALIPEEGRSLLEQAKAFPEAVTLPADGLQRDRLGRTVADPAFARHYYFHDVEPELAEWAVGQLRPQPVKPFRERLPFGGWPDIPATSLLALADRCISVTWGQRLSRQQLGRPAVEIAGGHSPFLSRPAELAAKLVAL